jgi:glucosamine-6-phosphate deaminase
LCFTDELTLSKSKKQSMAIPSKNSKAHPVPGTNLPAFCFDTIQELSHYAAHIVAGLIRERAALGQKTVIGLPAGSTPLTTFRELIRLHREESLDFSSVELFLLDEYYRLAPQNPQSHQAWLREHLVQHVNIPPDQMHCLDGNISEEQLEAHCLRFEEAIEL